MLQSSLYASVSLSNILESNSMKQHNVIAVLNNSREFKALDKQSRGQLSRAVDGLKSGESITVTAPNNVAAQYVHIEDAEIKSSEDARKFAGSVYNHFKGSADSLDFKITTEYALDLSEGAELAAYEFNKYKTTPKPNRLQTVTVNGYVQPSGIATSVNYARDLITEPGNQLYPAEYAKRVKKTLTKLGVKVKVYNQEQLTKMGFNLLLSVGQGSQHDSQVVVMEYLNGSKKSPTVALVGKGVTFDSGGISIKPSKGMGDMKYDMAGSAAVVGTMHALASNKVKKNVIGIIGLVENMPDGKSIKPGDVVTSLSGLTVENLNTDAEGRLVLADILTHVQTYKPDVIVDLATLTGAIVVSLGSEMAGLFTNSTALEQELVRAGKDAGENYWRMPMGENWAKQLDSDIADMQNIGGPDGGSTTAAEFLYRFVDDGRAWAHLDIAGMAWEDKGKPCTPKGAAGFGIRTLYNLVNNGELAKLTIDENMKY